MKYFFLILIYVISILSNVLISSVGRAERSLGGYKYFNSELFTPVGDGLEILAEKEQEASIETSWKKVNPKDIKEADKIVNKSEYIHEFLEFKDGHLKNSYSYTKSISYKDEWYREYQVYLPKFTDEISYHGSNKIKEYYKTEAKQHKKAMNDYFAGEIKEDHTEINDTVKTAYYYANYSVEYYGRYVSVVYDQDLYMGGAHGLEGRHADTFNMHTGRLMYVQDFLKDDEKSLEIIKEAIKDSVEDGVNVTGIDDMEFPERFRLKKKGISFIFSPYELGSYADGIREVVVPYDKLEDVLLLDLKAEMKKKNKR